MYDIFEKYANLDGVFFFSKSIDNHTILTLTRTLAPCFDYTDVVEFIQLYKSDPYKFYQQIQKYWEVRGWELESIFGYRLYFQT